MVDNATGDNNGDFDAAAVTAWIQNEKATGIDDPPAVPRVKLGTLWVPRATLALRPEISRPVHS